MNVHPAMGPTVPYGQRNPQFSAPFDPPTFDAMTTYIVNKYFPQPNYQRVQLTQGGPKCLFWSIYEPSTFIKASVIFNFLKKMMCVCVCVCVCKRECMSACVGI